MYTLKQKYDWLCDQLKITDIDCWEKDALISLPSQIYFQFGESLPATVDEAILMAMTT